MNTNKLFYILIGVIVAAVFLTIVLVLRGVGGTATEKVTLEFWGVFDHPSAFTQLIQNFQTQNPDIKVKYRELGFSEYEKTLIDSLASGTGPDIVMIQNNWIYKHGDKLQSLPSQIPGEKKPLFTIQDFKNQFVDVAYTDLVYGGQIYGMPLYIDTLALLYNKDLFNSASITRPPQDWAEVNQDVQRLTKYNAQGNIIQQGIALGTARNINRSTDILMDMMIQSGVQMTDPDGRSATFAQTLGQTALQYYTDFANPRKQVYTWNDTLHYSIDAFSEGSLAMVVGYAHHLSQIRAKSPRLNFAVAPMPQASTADIRNFSNYWALSVPKKSAHPIEAWKFITYAASKEGASSYLNLTQRPAARRDLIDLQRTDSDLGVFAVQALTARSWIQVDENAIETIFANMIDDVNYNRSIVRDAIEKAQAQVNVLMSGR
ncbi:extracellular solute-binding protein [Candidatus Parcubacteria bacterium]|nr:extracellular solute-binding protein [Candidatus Parcubacteria bacterium]